jgi:HAD superfamily hydrolase (TIGR01662 family)
MSDSTVFDRYRLFIFDADDTLRRTILPGKPCPHAPGEWVLMPRVHQVLAGIPWGEPGSPRLGVASNQDQVAYGQLSVETARDLLRDMTHSATGYAPPDPALQLCPHPLELDCECRKPKPGMLVEIMGYYGIEPNETLYVGNHEVDHQAALGAGTDFSWAQDFFA